MQVKAKKLLIAALALALTMCLAWGGWTWYDNNVDRSGWVEQGNAIYYRDFHGNNVTGWQDIGEHRYHFGEDHALTTGWLVDGDDRYYFGDDGAMVTGWLEAEDGHYYLDENGILLTGWQEISGSRYYLGEDGRMHTGWLELDGLQYYLGEDGTIVTGWLDWENDRFYLNEAGNPITGWATLEENTYFFSPEGTVTTGWADLDDERYYFSEAGILLADWQEIDGNRYYLGTDGRMYTGWLELGEYDYYLHPDGAMAVGPTQIDEKTFYFTPKGIHVVLVNANHPIPTDYAVDLVAINGSLSIDKLCADALDRMVSACQAAGFRPVVSSAYRSYNVQSTLYKRKVDQLKDQGYGEAQARQKAGTVVALPGTSEHQLGLAVDIVDSHYTLKDRNQADTETQKWLMEHCWEYGFILRYLDGTSDITGIIYEPWHYRYVGTEVSLEMQKLGITLEEYLGAVEQE